jgi:hypothetical protein
MTLLFTTVASIFILYTGMADDTLGFQHQCCSFHPPIRYSHPLLHISHHIPHYYPPFQHRHRPPKPKHNQLQHQLCPFLATRTDDDDAHSSLTTWENYYQPSRLHQARNTIQDNIDTTATSSTSTLSSLSFSTLASSSFTEPTRFVKNGIKDDHDSMMSSFTTTFKQQLPDKLITKKLYHQVAQQDPLWFEKYVVQSLQLLQNDYKQQQDSNGSSSNSSSSSSSSSVEQHSFIADSNDTITQEEKNVRKRSAASSTSDDGRNLPMTSGRTLKRIKWKGRDHVQLPLLHKPRLELLPTLEPSSQIDRSRDSDSIDGATTSDDNIIHQNGSGSSSSSSSSSIILNIKHDVDYVGNHNGCDDDNVLVAENHEQHNYQSNELHNNTNESEEETTQEFVSLTGNSNHDIMDDNKSLDSVLSVTNEVQIFDETVLFPINIERQGSKQQSVEMEHSDVAAVSPIFVEPIFPLETGLDEFNTGIQSDEYLELDETNQDDDQQVEEIEDIQSKLVLLDLSSSSSSLYDRNISKKIIPLANMTQLGYSPFEITQLAADALDIIVKEAIARPRSGIPPRWKVVAVDDASAGATQKLPQVQIVSQGDEIVQKWISNISDIRQPPPQSKSRAQQPVSQVRTTNNGPRTTTISDRDDFLPPVTPNVAPANTNDSQNVYDEYNSPVQATGRRKNDKKQQQQDRPKRIYDGRRDTRIKVDQVKQREDPPPPKSVLWMSLDDFRILLRKEAALRLRILGEDWADVIKEESDWRLDLYRDWLWTLHNGVGSFLVESRSDRIRRLRQDSMRNDR